MGTWNKGKGQASKALWRVMGLLLPLGLGLLLMGALSLTTGAALAHLPSTRHGPEDALRPSSPHHMEENARANVPATWDERANLALEGRSLAMETAATVRIPSPEGTGLPTGTLVVRVFGPPAGAARYPEGAPVVVYVPGADSRGSLNEELSLARDMVRVVFLFPGGCDGSSCSDGTYDHRGLLCIAALRDVILYAAGALADVQGHTIDEVVEAPVLHDNIGLFGSSNGGNIIVAVAALHGNQLAGHLRYLVQWESPVSSQMTTVELGPPLQDCPGWQRAKVNSVNPRYLAYGPLTVTMDYSQLTFDPLDPQHPVFWDGNGDGRYSTVYDPATGCQSPDLNGNGTMEMNEDFPLVAYEGEGKKFYSRPATRAMADQGIFPGPWPSDIATVAEAEAAWEIREAVRLYPTATLKIPDLKGMILASTNDHVQIAPDRPHIRQAFEGWRAAGAWVKINPAPSYAIEISPALSTRPDLPDNAPNTPPTDWSADDYTYPDDLDRIYYAAAVHEMADLVRKGGGYELYLPLVLKGRAPGASFEEHETYLLAPNGESIHVRWWKPKGGGPFPAVVVVPNVHSGSAASIRIAPYRHLVENGFVLVGFEPEGIGESTGEDTCWGPNHQADLKVVVEHIATLPYVDAGNIGLVSFSGAALLAGTTIGRYPDLPVAYWVDGEGPHDGSIIISHQPDCGDLCGHCNTTIDPSPENVAWWAERSPVNFIGHYRGHYLRLQAEIDHAQGSGYFTHALTMNNTALAGGVPWVRINLSDLDNPVNQTYPLNDPSQWPVWYSGRLSEHHPEGETGMVVAGALEMATLIASQ